MQIFSKKIKRIEFSPHFSALIIIDAFKKAGVITEKQIKEIEKYVNNPELSEMTIEDYLKWRDKEKSKK